MTEHTTQSLLAQAPTRGEIAAWSETLRNDFCATFDARVRVARYISFQTACLVWETAHRRHFVSAKHLREVIKGFPGASSAQASHNSDQLNQSIHVGNLCDKKANYVCSGIVGGRGQGELQLIAVERSDEILKNLPPLSKAVKVIDPVTARKIDRRDVLQAEGETLREKLDEICVVIDMGDLDQSMSIGDFRALVVLRDNQRKDMLKRINVVSDEGQRLEAEIAKALYAGLPGLSEAVIEVVRAHIEQALGLESLGRRVTEHVKFGDSDAAVELLRVFEKDEVTISEDVSARFKAALEQLKVAKKKPAKELAPTKRSKR